VHLEFTLKEIKQAAGKFLAATGDKRIFAFHGSMGAGKTTFIHAVCEVMGVKDAIGSPTFSIINEYIFSENGQTGKIFHIDLYRLKDEKEAMEAGVEDCLYSDHICFIEWPEKAPGIFPPETLHVFIKTVNETTRILSIGDN
jgi:tRNA threonylcarbamoyladenosine biosynthesis protein TsaE